MLLLFHDWLNKYLCNLCYMSSGFFHVPDLKSTEMGWKSCWVRPAWGLLICERYITDPTYRFVEAHRLSEGAVQIYNASVVDLNRDKQQI